MQFLFDPTSVSPPAYVNKIPNTFVKMFFGGASSHAIISSVGMFEYMSRSAGFDHFGRFTSQNPTVKHRKIGTGMYAMTKSDGSQFPFVNTFHPLKRRIMDAHRMTQYAMKGWRRL